MSEGEQTILEETTVPSIPCITEYKQIEEERERFEERLSALNTYSRQLNMAESMEEIHGLTLNAMEKTLGFEYASFLTVDENVLRVMDQRGYESLSVELPLDGSKRGVTVKAANKGKPVYIRDTRKEEMFVEALPDIRSELAVPMKIGGKVLGVLNVERKKLDAFSNEDQRLLEILASHAATAVRNFRYAEKQRELVEEVRKRSEQLAALMKSSIEMMRTKDLRQRLKVIAEAIQGFGWRRAVIALNAENLDTTDLVTVGLTPEEEKYLWENRQPGHVWRERLGPQYERFRIGEFYYLPWSDPFVREHFTTGVVYSKIPPEEMVDWHPQDLLYAPLRLPGERIVGRISIDDPLDGRRPTKESLAPLELFLYQAAVAIENAQLIKDLELARNELKEYADELESKVEERTRELVESEKKYSTLVEHANDGVAIVQDGRLSFMNKRLEDMTGYSREELMGKSFVDMLPESEVELVKSRYEDRMRGKPVPDIYETKVLPKNGDVIPVELNATVISYGGRPADLVMVRDIRERKKMEEQLLRAEKLAAIGELAASVGHDLRNPLTGISGAVYYLKMKMDSKMDEKSRAMLDLIEDDVKYSNKIVNDLLDFSGEIHLNWTMVGVRSLIRGTLSRIEVPEKVKISELTKNTPKVPVDVDQMTRAFENLITNAIEAMPNGGRLEIKSKKTGNSLKITFGDTGMGISKKNLNKLFTPLFTTKAKGVGLGLAICKRIINAHGGSVNIESKEGKGALVTVTIPIMEEKPKHRE